MRKHKLTDEIIQNIEAQVILMLLNSIENKDNWDVNNPYYAEAFGIFRCLATLNYCKFENNINAIQEKENVNFWLEFCQKQAKEIKAEFGIKKAIQIYEDKCKINLKLNLPLIFN
jgi:hypothetical protein